MGAEPGPEAATLDELGCLEAMRRGDPACLGGFFEAWGDRLYRLALRLTGDPATAEDVVQEAFLKLMRGADRFEGRSGLATWLYRVAYNASLDRLRERKAVLQLPEDEHDAPLPLATALTPLPRSPEALLRDSETREALERAIAELPHAQRAAFLLRDVEGLTTAQAADALGLSEANLKVRLHRARLRLRERLAAFAASHDGREGAA
jgi:RNA polymerase sigma-70 factor (ECF subfamily)